MYKYLILTYTCLSFTSVIHHNQVRLSHADALAMSQRRKAKDEEIYGGLTFVPAIDPVPSAEPFRPLFRALLSSLCIITSYGSRFVYYSDSSPLCICVLPPLYVSGVPIISTPLLLFSVLCLSPPYGFGVAHSFHGPLLIRSSQSLIAILLHLLQATPSVLPPHSHYSLILFPPHSYYSLILLPPITPSTYSLLLLPPPASTGVKSPGSIPKPQRTGREQKRGTGKRTRQTSSEKNGTRGIYVQAPSGEISGAV